MSIVGRKTFEQLTYLCQIYTAYSFYRCRFGVDNTWGMFEELNEEDKRRFNFDFEVRARGPGGSGGCRSGRVGEGCARGGSWHRCCVATEPWKGTGTCSEVDRA